ncbi:anthranilate synthase component II [Eubacterium pyruvativorans]|uniref:anthranilate synthase component II n=1 Tax=Eubacterium pyruvativorans TaxID=155865 RepID=UPI0023F02D4E|nr:aminodeoxychorismate/anthranilate synthase component II [Eubacterium pyruvativorans]MCI5746906.1 aminodeoxychorismate/anthranilate synthase component II [Eubacterium pyruvativorans]
MIYLIDNYDSFSYNLYQLIGSLHPELCVVRNDALTVRELEDRHPEAIVISPGPGRPEDAGICIETVRKLGDHIPILGVCLGHQSIVTACGGRVGYARTLMHGRSSLASLDTESTLFRGLPRETEVARYHSLAADLDSLPECLRITASTEDGEIMAVEHETCPIYGMQFHPESVMTPEGRKMMENFLRAAAEFQPK